MIRSRDSSGVMGQSIRKDFGDSSKQYGHGTVLSDIVGHRSPSHPGHVSYVER